MDGIKANLEKIAVINQWTPPQTIKGV